MYRRDASVFKLLDVFQRIKGDGAHGRMVKQKPPVGGLV
jgi:hypothetical protein